MKKSKLLLTMFLLFSGCAILPGDTEYRYLPYHENATLLKGYSYISHTASSVTYQAQVSGLAWYNSDISYFQDEFSFTGDGTFELLNFSYDETNIIANSSTVLLIDQSGSYLEIDPHNNRTKAMNKFLEDFVSPSDFLMGGFSKSGLLNTEPVEYASSDFTSAWNNPAFLYELAGRTGGDCLLLDAIDDAIDKLSASPKSTRNLVVLVHQGDTQSSSTLTDVATKANTNNVQIHVITFGDEPSPSDVWSLAEQTGGMMASCRNESDVITVFDNLERLLNVASNVNTLTIRFTPSSGGVTSGNEFENQIRITDSFSEVELSPVYVKVKIP